jgi:hypothetical protein
VKAKKTKEQERKRKREEEAQEAPLRAMARLRKLPNTHTVLPQEV